jgi:hypothetical protein
MILPIKLTDKPGLPGQGVPQFTIDPSTGLIMDAEFWPAGAGAIDAATGEPAVQAQIGYGDDPGLWSPAAAGQTFGPADPNQLNPAAIWDYRGTQWTRRGSYQTESAFDKWRRAGKPTACSLSGRRGRLGDWTGTIQQAIDAGVIGAAASSLPPGSVIQSTPGGGITVYNPGAVIPGGAGNAQVAVAGSASAGAWILGGLAAVAVIYVLKNR